MKKYTKTIQRIALLACTILIAHFSQAQNASSNGYVNVDSVLKSMPGFADSIKKLDNIRIMYQNQYNYLLVGLQQKIKEYETRKDSFSPYIANIKLQEIKRDQANLDTFQRYSCRKLNKV